MVYLQVEIGCGGQANVRPEVLVTRGGCRVLSFDRPASVISLAPIVTLTLRLHVPFLASPLTDPLFIAECPPLRLECRRKTMGPLRLPASEGVEAFNRRRCVSERQPGRGQVESEGFRFSTVPLCYPAHQLR